jgi:hypothetical protein
MQGKKFLKIPWRVLDPFVFRAYVSAVKAAFYIVSPKLMRAMTYLFKER